MEPLKENQNPKTPGTNNVKKRPSLASPFSAASPSVRPLQKKENSSCSVVPDSNLEGTRVESTVYEQDLTQATFFEELNYATYKTIFSTKFEGGQFNKKKSGFCGVVDGNLEETAVESTVSEEDLTQTMGYEELDDAINKTISSLQLECSEFDKEKGNHNDPVDGNLEETAVESTVFKEDLTQTTGCQDLDDTINKTISSLQLERSEFDKASFSSSLMDDNSVLGINLPSLTERQSGLKRSLSPIACLSKRDSSASSSSTLAPLHLSTRQSPVFSTDRKYNLNDSDISFLINENRVYDMALRKTSISSHETEQLKKNLIALEEEKSMVLEQLRSLSVELEKYRTKSTSQDSEILEANRKLDERERIEIALRQSEKCRLEASTQCSAIENELNTVRVKLDSLEQVEATVERLKNECAVLQEQLCAEKLGYDVLNREVEQLRREKNACNEAIEQVSFALKEAETRASIAEKDLLNHTKCHTEELRSRIVELETQIAAYPVERECLENKLAEQLKKETLALAKNEKTMEALEKAEAEIADLRKAKDDLQNEVRLMKESHEDYIARTEKLAATVVELEVQVDLLQCERDELKDKMVVADERHEKAIANAEEMIDSLKSDIESGLSERELLCNRLAAAENSKGILERDFAEMRNSMMELESTIDMLKSEVRSKSEELAAANDKLKAEIATNAQTANAFTSLEKEHLRLKKEKETFYVELEEQRKCYAFEVQTAQKLEEMTKEICRMEQEICESKASRVEADMQLTQLHKRCGELAAEKQQLEARLSNLIPSADHIEQTAKRPSNFDEELKKLRKQLEIKTREIDRLAGLCDEFDEIEDNYRRELFAAIKERDQLKAQLSALKSPEDPNLEVAFTEGMEALTLETSFGHSNCDVNICDEADESEERMKNEITELKKQVAALRGDLTRIFSVCVPSSDMCGDGIKVASSSQKLLPDAHNVSAGPAIEGKRMAPLKVRKSYTRSSERGCWEVNSEQKSAPIMIERSDQYSLGKWLSESLSCDFCFS
ncbi:unnamed protein product [Angiostrongylus costaricensis]|uniref:TACC_C domain-containing protein n=1 Tax=Angiostrongylus costaricensis TaxID=334426 RepID=A0A0R3PGJ6_ANGCS|nr:unnamed protein product [Angiostrongylus costaricensis]